MNIFIVSILFTTLLLCQVQYNNDIKFDFINLQENNLVYGNDEKSLHITLCGLLNYKCEKQQSIRILEKTKIETSNTSNTNTVANNNTESTNENKITTQIDTNKEDTNSNNNSNILTSTYKNTPKLDNKTSESQVIVLNSLLILNGYFLQFYGWLEYSSYSLDTNQYNYNL